MTVKVGYSYVHRQTGDTVFVWGLPTQRHCKGIAQRVSFGYLDGKNKGKYDMLTKSEFQATFREKDEEEKEEKGK